MIDVKVQSDTLVFSDGFARPVAPDEKAQCVPGRKYKAVKGRNGEYRLLYWADIHRHSGYSLLDGCIPLDEMVKYTSEVGALTDHGNMIASLQYYNAMKKAGKIPIVGEEFYCETIDGEKSGCHLIVLAKNTTGYKNLCTLSSLAFGNIYRKPHITYEQLSLHKEGLIVTSACLSGEISRKLLSGSQDADRVAKWFKSEFGGDYYLEIQRHGLPEEDIVNPLLIDMAKRLQIPLVATTDAHYVAKEDARVHDALLCISTGSTFETQKLKFNGSGYHLHTVEEINSLFADLPEAVDNTLEIAEKCEGFQIETGRLFMPEFPIPAPYQNADEYLFALCKEGFKSRFSKKWTGVPDARAQQVIYIDRLKFELDTIKQMNFAGYFLIVWDFIRFAHEAGIRVGPGRGSGAGSLVLYCLRITDMDPIENELLFERFLNPDRMSMPDIDTDFPDEDRERVIEYVSQKYGEPQVSRIMTVGTMCAKSAIRDVAKVFGATPSEAARWSALVPDGPDVTLDQTYKESPEFEAMAEASPQNKEVFRIAKKLEGLPRNISTHACGVIIAPSAVSGYIPQMLLPPKPKMPPSVPTTQYDMAECETMGLLKMDFLGLRTLGAIQTACDEIERNHSVAVNNIPLYDVETYQFLSRGHTAGVFQCESDGLTGVIKKMLADAKASDPPEKGREYFERMIAAVALYRPGPMDSIPQYLSAMKTGKIVYDHPWLEPILKSTYGVLVYQEQIMFAVRRLAGFSAGQSDTIRKAMGKKKQEVMDEYGEYFLHGSEVYDSQHPEKPLNIKGCVKNGISEATAQKIWDKMVSFAKYAFNRSHAAVYARLAVETAWLSCHYPAEFLCGTLNSYIGNAEKIRKYATACKRRRIKLLAPSVNKSELSFSVEMSAAKKTPEIRFGLGGIKDVGKIAATDISAERCKGGEFKSLNDFLARVSPYGSVNKSALAALNWAGAFDDFDGTKQGRDKALPKMAEVISTLHTRDENQCTLWDCLDVCPCDIAIPDVPEADVSIIAEKEDEVLGCYLHSPLDDYSHFIKAHKEIIGLSEVSSEWIATTNKNQYFYFCGIVKDVKIIPFKNKKGHLAKFVIDDNTALLKCVVFSSCQQFWRISQLSGQLVLLKASVKQDDFGLSAVVRNISTFVPAWKNRGDGRYETVPLSNILS